MKINIAPYDEDRLTHDIAIELHDTWNMDTTLARIIFPMLAQLRHQKHGVPHEFAQVGGESYSDQGSFDFYAETTDEWFTVGVERWNKVLEKMIWSFQQIAEGRYEDTYHLSQGPHTSFDSVGLDLHEERIQEGLELFAKYYRALWD